MGLKLYKKGGSGYYLGYGGFNTLRCVVAKAFDEKFGEVYSMPVIAPTEAQRKGYSQKLHKAAIAANKRGNLPAWVWNEFLNASDCEGVVSPVTCQLIYDKVKDIKDAPLYGYMAQDDPFDHNQFVALLKECIEHNSELAWE